MSNVCSAYADILSWSTISLEGVKPLSAMFDTIGFQARSVEDIALVAQQFGVVGKLEAPKVAQLRLGYVMLDCVRSSLTDEVKGILELSKTTLRRLGASIVDVELDAACNGLSGIHGRLVKLLAADAGMNLLGELLSDRKALSFKTQQPVANRLITPRSELTAISDDLALLRPKMDALARQYDSLITPTAQTEPLPVGKSADGTVQMFGQVCTFQ